MPAYQFIERFCAKNSIATKEQKKQLNAQIKQLNELIVAPDSSNILAHLNWLGDKLEKPQQLINLLHLCLMPFVARKQAMQEWYAAEIEKLPVEISNLSKQIVSFLKIRSVQEYRDAQYDYQTLPEERNQLAKGDPKIAPLESKIAAAYTKLCYLKDNDPDVKRYNELQNQRDILVRKQQALLANRDLLSFPATHHPAIYHAITLLDTEDQISFAPNISLLPEDSAGKPYIGYLECELTYDTLRERTLDGKTYYLNLDSGNNIFYHSTKQDIGIDSLYMPNQGLTITAIETSKYNPNYNLDLELINQFLFTLQLIKTYPAILELHPGLIANHLSSITSLFPNWANSTGINLLNEIDHNLLNTETFNELSQFDPQQVTDYQNVIDKFCSVEQKLGQLFKQLFPKEKIPNSFAEFKPFLSNPDFLSTVIEFAGGSLLNNEELFDIEDLIILISNDHHQKNIIQKLSQDRLIKICFYTSNRNHEQPEQEVKENISFDNNLLIKILLNTGHKLSLSTWHVLLLKLANEDACLDLIYHIKHSYPSEYIGFVCEFAANKGLRETKVIKLLNEKNVIKIGELSQQNILLNENQEAAIEQFIFNKRKSFFHEKINLSYELLDKHVIRQFLSLMKINILKKFLTELPALAKEYNLRFKNGQYVPRKSSEDLKKVANILNKLRTILKDQTVDCALLKTDINALLKQLSSEKERGLLEKLTSPGFEKLKKFLRNFLNHLTKRENLFNNLNNEADLYYLLLTPNIYYNLTADELTFFFSRINPDIMAQIITEFYGLEGFKSFASPLNKATLTFENLNHILVTKNISDNLDAYNQLRYEYGFPMALPEGATYTGEHYVDAFPLSAEHLYQFEASDMAAGEGILRNMYSDCLVNSHFGSKSASMAIDPFLMPVGEKVNSSTYYFDLVPACIAKLLDPDILSKIKNKTLSPQELQANQNAIDTFQHFKTRLQNMIQYFNNPNFPIVICGGAHYGNNHYVAYFIFHKPDSDKTHVLVVDPSADGPKGNNHKQKSTDKLRAIFEDIFPGCQFKEAGVTQQLRERSCGQNTLTTLENAFATALTNNPLLKITDGQLSLNKSALWMNGNNSRHLDYYLNSYFYLKSFVEKGYHMREFWNHRLMKISKISYYMPKDIKALEEEVFATEDYSFYDNVKNQNNSDVNDQKLNVIAALLCESHALSSDLMTVITQQFIQSFKLPDLNELTRIAARIRETSQDYAGDILEEITESGTIPLEPLISQAITLNLAPHIREALNQRISYWIDSGLSEKILPYDITAEQCLDIIKADMKFKEFYNRLSDIEKNLVQSTWLTQIDNRLTILKIKQAKQEIKAHCRTYFYQYLNNFTDIMHFEHDIFETILKNEKSPCYSAIKFLAKHNELSNIQELSLQLQDNLNSYCGAIYQQATTNLTIDNEEIIRQFYDQDTSTFVLSKGRNLESFTPAGFSFHTWSPDFLDFLLKTCNSHFNSFIYRTFEQQAPGAIAKLLALPEVDVYLNELEHRELVLLAAAQSLDYIDDNGANLPRLNQQLFDFLEKFGNQVNLPSILNICPTSLAIFIPAMQTALQRKIHDILNVRYQRQYDEFINVAILKKLDKPEFNEETIEEMLKEYSANNEPYIIEFIRQNKHSICLKVNDFYIARAVLLNEIIKFYKLFTFAQHDENYEWLKPFIQDDSTTMSSGLMNLYRSLTEKEQSTISHQRSSQDFILSIEQELKNIKMVLINWLKQQILTSMNNSTAIDIRPMRQMLIQLMNITAYSTKYECKSLPYFILTAQDDKEINQYLTTIEMEPVSETVEIHRLLDKQKIQTLGLHINLDKVTTARNMHQKKLDPSIILLGKDHHLTLKCVISAIDWWLSNNNSGNTPQLIYDLNNVISTLPINFSFDDILPKNVINLVLKYIDTYQLQNQKSASLNKVISYLKKTQELSNFNILNIRYLRYLIAQYKGNITPDVLSDFQEQFAITDLNTVRAFSQGAFFKALRVSKHVKKLEKILSAWISNGADEALILKQSQIKILKELIKECFNEISNNNKDYYIKNNKFTPVDNLLFEIARHIIKKAQDENPEELDCVLRWIYPELKEVKYPQQICNVLFLDYDDTSVDDILPSQRILLDSNHIVDIAWIINDFKSLNKLLNPYNQQLLTQNDIYKILLPSPFSQEIISTWLDTLSKKYNCAIQQHTPLTQRGVDALFLFCKNAFFPSGVNGYYNDAEKKKMQEADRCLLNTIKTWPPTEQNAFNNHPVPKLHGNDKSTIKKMMDSDGICVTQTIGCLALVLYAYDPKLISQLHPRVQKMVNVYLESHIISKIKISTNFANQNIGSQQITFSQLASIAQQFDIGDNNFYQALLATKNLDLLKKGKNNNNENMSQNSNRLGV